MSSIIKTGCAPSNTPDGKYFLQTDQACYAELKRGRTYIMTAQEEAKVSHYVIITNADFTATFNGDSDLVQVGRANNAIVMNVHRACRIDFVQGGNLEFKEGTAEFSSRITMGPNASGNVLVADSLPQQGDFAGQICSLTTGATYVWTGSQWSSTAGSSTLPTPTSANKFYGLVSTGSAWEANRGLFYRKESTSYGYLASGDIALIPLCRIIGTGAAHFSADIQVGQHARASAKIHVEYTYGGSFSNIGITYNSHAVPGFTLRMYETTQSERVGRVIYLGVVSGGVTSVVCSIWNVTFDVGDVALPESTSIIKRTDETLMSHYTKCVVPVSTAANQMLVSDGNGGWKVLAAGAVGTTLKMTSDGPAWST